MQKRGAMLEWSGVQCGCGGVECGEASWNERGERGSKAGSEKAARKGKGKLEAPQRTQHTASLVAWAHWYVVLVLQY
jgi:hypothetical protein